MYYHTVTNFKLPNNIEQTLQNINWANLPVATQFDRRHILKVLIRNKILIDGLMHYGLFLQHVGTLISYRLPEELEKIIRNQLHIQCSSLLAREAIIRLQIMYGGKIVPIHIDLTRQSSIVYPIKHEHNSSTVFYNCNNLNTRELINPKKCNYVNEVTITDMPMLLDVSIPHSVNYNKNIYTKYVPRISLSIKFEKLTFSAVQKELVR
jgi:hypothetical protein